MQPVPRIMQYRAIATQQPPPQQPVSRTKQFMKKYGYVGIGVYLALGTVDLATTMAIISVKGANRVKEAEDYMIGKAKGWIGMEHTPLEQNQVHEKPSLTLSLTAAITPAVARRLKNWGWLKNKLVKK
ncbi:hypothetical protein PS6_007018 [Mucor atramentarius]